jgi:hypothetical protein
MSERRIDPIAQAEGIFSYFGFYGVYEKVMGSGNSKAKPVAKSLSELINRPIPSSAAS